MFLTQDASTTEPVSSQLAMIYQFKSFPELSTLVSNKINTIVRMSIMYLNREEVIVAWYLHTLCYKLRYNFHSAVVHISYICMHTWYNIFMS